MYSSICIFYPLSEGLFQSLYGLAPVFLSMHLLCRKKHCLWIFSSIKPYGEIFGVTKMCDKSQWEPYFSALWPCGLLNLFEEVPLKLQLFHGLQNCAILTSCCNGLCKCQREFELWTIDCELHSFCFWFIPWLSLPDIV